MPWVGRQHKLVMQRWVLLPGGGSSSPSGVVQGLQGVGAKARLGCWLPKEWVSAVLVAGAFWCRRIGRRLGLVQCHQIHLQSQQSFLVLPWRYDCVTTDRSPHRAAAMPLTSTMSGRCWCIQGSGV